MALMPHTHTHTICPSVLSEFQLNPVQLHQHCFHSHSHMVKKAENRESFRLFCLLYQFLLKSSFTPALTDLRSLRLVCLLLPSTVTNFKYRFLLACRDFLFIWTCMDLFLFVGKHYGLMARHDTALESKH